jgi:histidine triad (HIT) family protein
MKADAITIEQFNEPAGGQLVFHIHFHILPRLDGVELKPHSERPADPGVIARHAEAIHGRCCFHEGCTSKFNMM